VADMVSLREFMDMRFGAIERELANLGSAIEKLASNATVTDLCVQVDEQEKRVIHLEADIRTVKWIGGAVASVVVALVVAWLRMLLF